jgi:hypothetical protein
VLLIGGQQPLADVIKRKNTEVEGKQGRDEARIPIRRWEPPHIVDSSWPPRDRSDFNVVDSTAELVNGEIYDKWSVAYVSAVNLHLGANRPGNNHYLAHFSCQSLVLSPQKLSLG